MPNPFSPNGQQTSNPKSCPTFRPLQRNLNLTTIRLPAHARANRLTFLANQCNGNLQEFSSMISQSVTNVQLRKVILKKLCAYVKRIGQEGMRINEVTVKNKDGTSATFTKPLKHQILSDQNGN